MFLIDCPWCGEREQHEFHCGGEAGIARPADPDSVDDAAWADYLFARSNTRGRYHERWMHSHGCGRWMVLVRDTVSDRILAVRKPGEPPPEAEA